MGHAISQKHSEPFEPVAKHAKDLPIIRVSSPPPSYAHAWDDIEAGPSVPLRPLLYARSPRAFAPLERPETPPLADRAAGRRAKHWKFTIPAGTLVGIGIGAYLVAHFRPHHMRVAPALPAPVVPVAPTTSPDLNGTYTLSGEMGLPSSNCDNFAACIVPFQTTLSFSGSGLSAQVFAPTTQYTGSVNASAVGHTYDFIWKDLQVEVDGCAQRHQGQVHVEATPEGFVRGINHDFVEILEDCAALSVVAGQSCQCDTSVVLRPEGS